MDNDMRGMGGSATKTFPPESHKELKGLEFWTRAAPREGLSVLSSASYKTHRALVRLQR